jgi:hypothetical protein
MADPIDVFADAVHVNVMAFGCTVQFAVSKPAPMSTGAEHGTTEAPATDRVATIRVTPEFLKGFAFLIRQQVLQYEANSGLKIDLPPDLMAGLTGPTGGREQWDRVWRAD